MRDSIFKQVQLGEPTRLNAINPRTLSAAHALAEVEHNAQREAHESELDTLRQQASDEARALVERAHQRAEEILQEAQSQRDAIHQEAIETGRAEGYEAGLAEGYEAAAMETMELLQSANKIIEAAKALEAQQLEEAEANAVRLMQGVLQEASLAVAQRIPAEVLHEAWQRAVKVHAIKSNTVIQLHPAHLQLIEALGDEATALLQSLPNTTFKTDSRLAFDAIYLMSDEKNLNLTLASVIRELCESYCNES